MSVTLDRFVQAWHNLRQAKDEIEAAQLEVADKIGPGIYIYRNTYVITIAADRRSVGIQMAKTIQQR